MIGKLIRGEDYVPFYIDEGRFESPTNKINFLGELENLKSLGNLSPTTLKLGVRLQILHGDLQR